MKKSRLFKVIMWIIIIIGIILIYKLGIVSRLMDIKQMQQWFKSLGPIAFLIYIAIYIFASIFMLPGSVLTIASGIAFGPILGAVLAIIGATCGATMSFLISKYLMRDIVKARLGDNLIYKKIDDGFKVNGYNFLILTRLVPIFPFNLQNYAYGLTSIKTSTYIFWSLICMIPGAFIYAYMAGEIAARGISLNILIKFTIAGIILFIVSLIPKYIAKKRGINLE
ncbi:TVP38/TMEM64 family protein [Candidatus Clostridium stratigraminis]|uniref:TVP38/TMEM64 family membrane protein n=1 Tax=Candidatus Clostridium stratigraminis TaxID=3381661 RepID=A0ABW8SZ05_9CLOT